MTNLEPNTQNKELLITIDTLRSYIIELKAEIATLKAKSL